MAAISLIHVADDVCSQHPPAALGQHTEVAPALAPLRSRRKLATRPGIAKSGVAAP